MKRRLGFALILGLAAMPLAWPTREAVASEHFLTPIVVDDAGKLLGPLIMPDGTPADYPTDYSSSVAAQLDPKGAPIGVSVSAYGLTNPYGNPEPLYLGYRQSHCTGPLYISLNVPSHAIAYPDFPTLLYPDPAAKPVLVTVLRTAYGPCRRYPVSYLSVPTKSVDVSSLGFTKHFSVSLVEGTAAGRPYAVDSQGHVIGPLFGRSINYGSITRTADTRLTQPADYSQVVLRLKPTGAIVSLSLTGDGFQTHQINDYSEVDYPTTDCTGQGYADLFEDNFIPHAYIDKRFPNDLFYKKLDLVDVHYRSYWNGAYCIKSDQGIRSAYPLRSVPIAAQGFTPPFSVMLH